MRPTPIHKWELPGVPSGFEVFVKRDDMTGSTLSGSKVSGESASLIYTGRVSFRGGQRGAFAPPSQKRAPPRSWESIDFKMYQN